MNSVGKLLRQSHRETELFLNRMLEFNLHKCLLFMGLLFFTAGLAKGQVDRGSITGTAVDPTNHAVVGVEVTAINSATGVRYSTISDQSGVYNLRDLPVGTYSVNYRKQGFAQVEHNGITLEIGQVARIDITLKVGSVSEEVTVTASAPILQTDDMTVGTDVNSQAFNELPQDVNGGREIDTLAYEFTPTVSGSNWATSVGGSQAFTKEVLIDGTSTDAYISGWLGESSPSPEAISEFKVDTAGISAEAGRTGGGVFDFTMKSGTNSWHGTAAGFLANEFLDANTYDNNWWIGYLKSTDPTADLSQYKRQRDRFFDYAGSYGGPIKRNKAFFYTAFERYITSDWRRNPSGATVPTSAMLGGDFSAILNTSAPLGTDSAGNTIYQGAIFDPATDNVFPGNVIPAGRISPLASKIINIFQKDYQPTNSSVQNNYPSLVNSNPLFHQTQFSVKLDYTLSDKQHLSGSYIYNRRPRYYVDTLWQNNNNTNAGPLDGGHSELTRAPQYRLQDSWSVTPNLLNVLSLTYSQENVSNIAISQAAGGGVSSADLGFLPETPIFPNLNFSGVNGYSEPSTSVPWTLNYFSGYNSSLDDSLSWVRGHHTVTLGGELRDERMNNSLLSNELAYNFATGTGVPLSLSQSVRNVVGFGLANFELGDVDSASDSVQTSQHSRRWSYSLFAEDNIKLTEKLTVDIALRWDANSPLHELNGNWADFNLTAANPAFNGYPGAITYLSSPSASFETRENYLEFGPHAGGAYRLTQRLVARGSFGMYYVPIESNGYNAVPYGFAAGLFGTNAFYTPGNDTVGFNWDQNSYAGVYIAPSKYSGIYMPWGPTVVDPDTLTLGRTENWNVGGQYELAKNMRLEVNYIGNIGRKLHDGALSPYYATPWQTYDQYLNTTNTCAHPGGLSQWINSEAVASWFCLPYPYPGFAGTGYMTVKPFPQAAATYSPMFVTGSPIGHTSYNALVVEAISRRTNGLTFDMSYTMQDGRGNTSTAFVQTSNQNYFLQDPYAYNDYAEYPNTPKYVVKGYILYDLPVGKGKRFDPDMRIVEPLVSGWEIGTAHSYQTGTPMTTPGASPTAAGTLPGWTAVYENVVQNPHLGNTFKRVNEAWNPSSGSNTGALFFDPTNFSDPAPGTLGNAPFVFSNWHSFGYNTEDLSLLKNFKCGADQRYRVQLRAEFFDVLNRHHWDAPNMTTGSPYFGMIMGASGNRVGQLGARLDF